MTWMTAGPWVAWDGDDAVRDATGDLFLTSDSAHTNPLPLQDLNALTLAEATSDSFGILRPLQVDVPDGTGVVVFKSGERITTIPLWEGMVASTAASATSAALSAAAAEAAQAAAEAAGGGGGGGTGGGNMVAQVYSGGAYPAQPSTYPTGTIRVAIGPEPANFAETSGVVLDMYIPLEIA